MCKIPWYCDAFLPLLVPCRIVTLPKTCSSSENQYTNSSVLGISIWKARFSFFTYLSTRWYFAFPAEGVLTTVRSGHFRSWVLWDSWDFWRSLFTGRHGQVPSRGRKRRETVDIVDLDIGKARWVVYFMFLWIFVVSDRLIRFHPSDCLLFSILSFTSAMTYRTWCARWIWLYRCTYLLYVPGKSNRRCWPYSNQFSDHKLTYSWFSLSGLDDSCLRPRRKRAIS